MPPIQERLTLEVGFGNTKFWITERTTPEMVEGWQMSNLTREVMLAMFRNAIHLLTPSPEDCNDQAP
jgi:hypothetical protein